MKSTIAEPNFPKCPNCGGNVNFPSKTTRPDAQTAEQIRLLFGTATHAISYGGPVEKECFIEHHRPFMGYVWYERVGDRLIERPYADDKYTGPCVFGIWPLITRDEVHGARR